MIYDLIALINDTEHAAVQHGRGTCANQNKETKCGRNATPGHIYCNSCRLQTGGYSRYTPPRSNHIRTY